MALFDWRDDYAMRIPSVDAQHRGLVSTLNRLHQRMVTGGSDADLSAILDELVEYTRLHFAHEEHLFAVYGYPAAPGHIVEHQRLVQEVGAFVARNQAGSATIGMELTRFLKDWLIHHILESDAAYSTYLVERGAR